MKWDLKMTLKEHKIQNSSTEETQFIPKIDTSENNFSTPKISFPSKKPSTYDSDNDFVTPKRIGPKPNEPYILSVKTKQKYDKRITNDYKEKLEKERKLTKL